MGAKTSSKGRVRTATSGVRLLHLDRLTNHSAIRALSSFHQKSVLFEQRTLFGVRAIEITQKLRRCA